MIAIRAWFRMAGLASIVRIPAFAGMTGLESETDGVEVGTDGVEIGTDGAKVGKGD